MLIVNLFIIWVKNIIKNLPKDQVDLTSLQYQYKEEGSVIPIINFLKNDDLLWIELNVFAWCSDCNYYENKIKYI